MAIIQNENDKILQASTNRLTAVAVALEPSSTVFIKSRNIAGTKPTSIELKTAITGYNNTPDYKWKYRPTLLSTWTTMPAATAAALSYSVFNTQRGESNGVEYKVTTSKSGWEEASDQSTIEYKSTSNDLPVVTISRPSISLPASGEGVCDYSNTATVITVTIDKVSLTYNNVLGPNTFNVVASVSRGTATLGINTDGSFGSISGMNGTPLTATAEITYTVTSRDVDNNEKVDVIKQTISKVASGTASTITYLSATADTIVKDAVSAAQSGKHSTTLVRGYSKTGNSLAQLYGYVSTQLGSKAVGNRINSSNILDTPISDSENILDVTYKLYATVSSTEVLDTEIIPILFKNSNSIVVNLTNDSCSIPVNSSNTAGVYTNAGTDIHVYQGATELVYDTLGTIAGTWKISSNTSGTTGISPGSLSSSTSLIKYAIAASPSNITAAVATIRYTITGTDLKGVAFSVTKDQTFSRIAAGIDAAIGQLSNDSHVLPILVSGTPNYVGCNTTMTVSVGAKDDSNNWTFIPTTSTGVICSSTNSGRTQTISQVTAALSTVTIVAKHKQYVYSDVTCIFTITKGQAGGITANLSNDTHVVPVTTAGVADYTGCNTTMTVYVAGIDDSTNWNYVVTTSTGVICSSTNSGRTQTVSQVTAAVSTVTIVASKANYSNITCIFTITKAKQGDTGAKGIDAAIGQLSNDSHVLPILVSGTPNYVGCNTTMTVSVGAKDDSNNWTFIPTTSTGVICSSTNSGRTQTISQVTAALSTVTIVAKHKQYVYSDVTCIFTITKGQAGGITANLSNDTHVVPVTTAGVADYTGCNTTMTVYVAGIDDSTNWNYVVTTSTGVICSSTNSGRTQTVSQVTAAVSTVTIVASKANYSNITCIFTITKAKQGDTGAKGDEATKAVTLSIFKWAASTQTTSSVQSTLTWSTNTATPIPSGWDTAAITSPGSGYTLYMWSVTVTALASVTSTTFNWSTGSIGSIGYRQDGSIGIQGAGARKAYTVVTSTPPAASGTPIGVPVTIGGDAGPGSIWSTTLPTVSTSTASTTYTLWVVDGNYYPSGSPSYSNQTVWGSPYLATFKVDSLQAVSANVGVLNIASGGNIHSGKASSADTTAGFFLGNDSGTPKFSVGSSAKYLTWNGTDLDIKGAIKGDSSIDITGSAIFGGVYSGSYAPSGHSVALSANPNSTANAGIYARSGSASSMAVWASGAALGSTGVYATCTSTGTAGKFYPNAGGTGISSNGPSDFGTIRCDAAAGVVPISVTYSTTMCTNLNANYLGGKLASAFSLTGHNHSGVYATATHNHIGVYCNGALTDAGYTGVNATSGLTFTSSTISGYRFSSVVGSATVRYEATSDRRLKEAIVPEKLGIEFILKLKPVRYKLRTGPIDFHGFIAQDLDDIDLDSTNDSLRITNEDGTRGIDYVSLISPIVKALQELTSKVSILEVELQELKNGKL